jgi:hypothetical protein
MGFIETCYFMLSILGIVLGFSFHNVFDISNRLISKAEKKSKSANTF